MPFKSKAQQRWMFANHPRMAKRWAEHTKDFKSLPEHASSDDDSDDDSKEVKQKAAAYAQHLRNRVLRRFGK